MNDIQSELPRWDPGAGVTNIEFLERYIFPNVTRPGRYAGGELNAAPGGRSRAGELRFCLAFPDRYEIGMSYLGLQIIYSLLQELEGAAPERVFAPDEDMARLLKQTGMPIFALESLDPIADFQVIGFSLTYEMNFTNALWMLDLAGVPLRSAGRGPEHPLVIAGGPCAANPEPMARFIDAFVIGEAEEALPDLVRVLRGADPDESRDRLLRRLAAIDGVYVPALYEPRHDGRGGFAGLVPIAPEAPASIRRRWVRDLDRTPAPKAPILPGLDPVHSRVALEAARGCRHGCRFCQAGFFYRPYRERSLETLKGIAAASYENTGWEGFSILALNATDYSALGPLTDFLSESFCPLGASISLPSTRFDSFSLEILQTIKEARKTGLTLAVEAGSQSLRDKVNKNITENAIFEAVTKACALGWDLIKLYFMIGLPGETDEDVAAAVELIRRLAALDVGPGGRKLKFNITVAPFVPKPHTPFQWSPMADRDTLLERARAVKQSAPRRVKVNYHDVDRSRLEALLARGGREAADVIEAAYMLGCRQDAWSDHFDMALWDQALARAGVDLDAESTRRLEPDQAVPWGHIDSGVDAEYLAREAGRAASGQTTPPCPDAACGECGVCE